MCLLVSIRSAKGCLMENENALTHQQQLLLARELAKVIHANLPLESSLQQLARSYSGQKSTALSVAADIVNRRLMQGESLAQGLGSGVSREARMLASTIEIGQSAQRVDQALESWVTCMLQSQRSRQKLRGALVYPSMLTAIMVASIAGTAWNLIPYYEQAFLSIGSAVPAWFLTVIWLRQHVWLVALLMLAAVAVPTLLWWRRHCQFDAAGLPHAPALRKFLQAHAARLAEIAIGSGQPVHRWLNPLYQATGFNTRVNADTERPASALSLTMQLGLGRETAFALAALDAQHLAPDACQPLLIGLAEELDRQGNTLSQRTACWLPLWITTVVGITTVLAYVALIYWPWLTLFDQLMQPVSQTSTPIGL